MAESAPGGIWNVADEEPAPPQDVIAFAAGLLGMPPPPEEDFATAEMTPMARSFYADNKRVSIQKLKRELGFSPKYPTYREGLQALAAAGEGRD
jgi:nucleoside-diphosphate-sugar epimerase